jgi:methyl-accepting chemotaxis protein
LAVVVVASAAFVANRIAMQRFERSATRAIVTAAQGASATVDLYLRERQAAVVLLATVPTVVTRAQAAGARARVLGLDRLPVAALEERYVRTRILEPSPQANQFLARVRDDSDFAEIFFTDGNGLVVAASNPTSDFVQSDELWWQIALASGSHQDAAEFDESAGTAAIGLSARIQDPETGAPLGVLKAVLDLSRLSRILAPPSHTVGITMQVADSAGRVVAARERTLLLRLLPGGTSIALTAEPSVTTLRPPGETAERVASTPTNRGRWWVVARERAEVSVMADAVRRTVLFSAAALLALILVVMVWLSSWLKRQVSRPVQLAGDIASRVASGDLSLNVTEQRGGSEEISRLLSSVESMVTALRRLVGQIRSAAEDSAAMAQEISASTEQMSASTQEMANTCQSLTEQATHEADTVRAAAEDATRILGIATQLADGAQEAAARSSDLTDLASRHRERLVVGSEQLTRLANDLERGTADAEALADMSEEIQTFVKQAREIGSQTNMLALNAAIEASRAGGGESRGFAVVADEVRKLATQASRAATATAETVRNVLATLQSTRDRLSRLVESSSAVREIAESAAGGLAEVAKAAGDTSSWTDEISGAALELRRLVEEITQRLEKLAQGTEGVVAAAEQIAASAEEQSASTEEIAGSASQLAESAERLTGAVSSFRILGEAKDSPDIAASGAD